MSKIHPNDRARPTIEHVETAAVTITVPPARGARGFTRDRLTLAIIVAGIDLARPEAEAIVGERVCGRVQARPGALLFVYGEDRAPLDGHLRGHMLDLFRVQVDGKLLRLDHGCLDADTTDWVGVAAESIERARAGAYDDRRDDRRENVPLDRSLAPRTPPLVVLLALLALYAAMLLAPTPAASANVRATAAWSTTVRRGEWWPLPASVCDGALPSDYEAWSVRTGRRVGDARLFHGILPQRILGSSYRRPVRAYVWCEHDDTAPSWPMLRIIDAAVGKQPRGPREGS